MILHRFSSALRKQDWFTVVIETLIVIFGVFIGLQVNNWNENRELTKRGIALEAQLVADVRLIIEETRGNFAHIEQSVANVEWLKQAFSQTDVTITEAEFVEHANILSLPQPAKRSPAFIEALNSGGLGLINDTNLRNCSGEVGQVAGRLGCFATSRTRVQSLVCWSSGSSGKPLWSRVV